MWGARDGLLRWGMEACSLGSTILWLTIACIFLWPRCRWRASCGRPPHLLEKTKRTDFASLRSSGRASFLDRRRARMRGGGGNTTERKLLDGLKTDCSRIAIKRVKPRAKACLGLMFQGFVRRPTSSARICSHSSRP